MDHYDIGTPQIPDSLFSSTIPHIEVSISHYQTLRRNTVIPLETQSIHCPIRTKRLTQDNWKTLLTDGCKVYIPITFATIHHSLIDQYGHDRLIELEYVGHNRIRDDIQLNFKMLQIPIYTLFHACKVRKIPTYSYPMFVEMTNDQIQRDNLRFTILAWRTASRKAEKRIMDALKAEFHSSQMGGILYELRKTMLQRLNDEKLPLHKIE